MDIRARLQPSAPHRNLLRGLLAAVVLAGLAIPGLAEAKKPIGWVDGADQYGVWGWTCDPDAWGQSLTVHVYQEMQFIGEAVATNVREDLVQVCHGTTAHGFWMPWPMWMYYAEQPWSGYADHGVTAWALDNEGQTNAALLGGNSDPVTWVRIYEDASTRPNFVVDEVYLDRWNNSKVDFTYNVCNFGQRGQYRGVYEHDLSFEVKWTLTCGSTVRNDTNKINEGIEPGTCVYRTLRVNIPAAAKRCNLNILADSKNKFPEPNDNDYVIGDFDIQP